MNNLKQKYIGSALLLLLSSIVVKLISAVYKIPLTAYIGATGRGYFNIAYNLYMPVHAVIMGAFPIALSHLVSKYNEQGNSAKIYSLKKAGKFLLFIAGVLGTALIILLAKPYANMVGSDKSIYTIYVIAPTVFFSALCAGSRSLAEGFMNMIPTSVSQIIEAVFKLVFGLLFAKYSMSLLYDMYLNSGSVLGIACETEQSALSLIYPLTSAAAMGGVTVGAFFSMVYASVYTSVKYNSFTVSRQYTMIGSLKEIAVFSAPIIVSTIIQSVSTFLDNSSVQICLSYCDIGELKNAYKTCIEISRVQDNDIVTYIYGLFSSAQDFKNLLPGFTMALGVSAVPAISSGFEGGNKERLSSLLNSIFKYTSIIAFGGGVYLSLTARHLLSVLYGGSNSDIVFGTARLVEYYGFTMLFYCLAGVSVYAVQAVGKAKSGIPAILISAVLRIGINCFLVSKSEINIYGTVLSGAVGYLVIMVCNMVIFKKYTGVKYDYLNIVIKPFICSLFSYFFAKMIFSGIFTDMGDILNLTVISALFAVIFTILLILSKTICFSEIKFLKYCKK